MSDHKNIAVIVLAAGSASRLGHNKLLTRVDGLSLLERTLKASMGSGASEVVMVTGAYREENEVLAANNDVKTIFNSNWKKGIGSSIKTGMGYLLGSEREYDAVIVSVSDQPHLTVEVFNALIDKYLESGKPIIASTYAGVEGVPVLYDRSRFAELMQLPDDQGAKKAILGEASAGVMETVDFPMGEVDLDTREDLKKMKPGFI